MLLSQEQFSQEMCHATSQDFCRPAGQAFSRSASQEFSRNGPTRQGSLHGWTDAGVQQESVSLLDNSQETCWPARNMRRTLPGPFSTHQESISQLANSQEVSWPDPPAPRRTLPRPPTWPRITNAGRSSVGIGKGNSEDLKSKDVGGTVEGSKGPRAARWRLPSSFNKENITAQSAAKERDLKHHLSEISKQVPKL